MTKKAAMYARFSSDLQKDRSIDDQFALCQRHGKRENLKIVAQFSDRAKSGATLFDRPGLWDMMQAAKEKRFDTVIVESLDRLSRDQEDLPGIYKRLEFAGVKILTCNEGETTKLHIGIRSLVSSLFLADLGHKVRRGHAGRVREGKMPGAVPFGYRCVPGKPGDREIDPDKAKIVVRIFTEYALGRSPRAICLGLQADGIPSPEGTPVWNHQGLITGGSGRGILGNPIYRGELVWGTATRITNPDTGRKIRRFNTTPDERIVTAVPHLRIISDDLWNAVQEMRAGKARKKIGAHPFVARKEHLLQGLLRCECGSHMRITNNSAKGSRVGCAAAHQSSTCKHSRSYDLGSVEREVLACMRDQLADPARVQIAVREFHTEWAKQKRHHVRAKNDVAKRLANIQASIVRMVDVLEAGSMPTPVIVEKLQKLEAERVALVERKRIADSEAGVIDIHPAAIATYCRSVEQLHAAFAAGEFSHENRAAFRNAVASVVVHEVAKKQPYEITVYHRVEALMGMNLFPANRSPREMLADHGVPFCASGNADNSALPISQHGNVVSLGRWRGARAA